MCNNEVALIRFLLVVANFFDYDYKPIPPLFNMTSFVDHMKNITVPSMVQDINEMNHYWAMLTRIPGSGISAQPNMDVVTSHEEKLFPLDNGWYLRRETPVKGFTKKWPDPIHGPNELHIDGLEDMLQRSKDANDTATKRTLHKKKMLQTPLACCRMTIVCIIMLMFVKEK